MEQGPDFWCWFDTTQFSYHCVHPIHAKMFSIQMLLHFRQIVQRVCTLVLFIIIYSGYIIRACVYYLRLITVEPPITDTPNSGHLPYNGQQSMYQLNCYSSRIADNLRTPDNGQVSCTESHFPIEAHLL